MRSYGIKRVRVPENRPIVAEAEEGGMGGVFVEIELTDTIPAPPLADDEELPLGELTDPGICKVPSCGKPGGWHMAPEYCREHGLFEAGVAGAMRTRE